MTTTREFIQDQRGRWPVTDATTLVFGGCRVAVSANRPDMIAALNEYFDGFLAGEDAEPDIRITFHEAPALEPDDSLTAKSPDPGKTKIKEEFRDTPDGRLVRKRLTGLVFAFGGGENLGVGPCMDNLNQVVNFINNRYIEWELCRGRLLAHAAGVVLDGVGVAMAGFSGAGKSTLALHVMNLGATFVSNDRLMIGRSGDGLVMHGVAKLPRINPGTILHNPSLWSLLDDEEYEKFSNMPPEELWHLEHKFDAPIDQCFGPNRFRIEAPLRVLALLTWKHGAGPMTVNEVDLTERRDLLPAFMKSTGLFFRPGPDCRMPSPDEDAYLEILASCRVLEFSGGADFESAARLLAASVR